jgi:putative sigma-54 modulation protein
MEFIIKARNMELSEDLKERAEEKIKNKITKHFDRLMKIEVELKFEKNPKINKNNIVEVTVFTGGEIIRVEEAGQDMFEAIDRVGNKLERQIRRFRDKTIQHGRKATNSKIALTQEISEDDQKKVVKIKNFYIKPMSNEEAIMQMELLGHDFFVFINAETGNTAIIYKRKDKNYGLIEPNVLLVNNYPG